MESVSMENLTVLTFKPLRLYGGLHPVLLGFGSSFENLDLEFLPFNCDEARFLQRLGCGFSTILLGEPEDRLQRSKALISRQLPLEYFPPLRMPFWKLFLQN